MERKDCLLCKLNSVDIIHGNTMGLNWTEDDNGPAFVYRKALRTVEHGFDEQVGYVQTPVPLRRVRTTRSSTHSHPFQVSLPNPRTLSHKSSFTPRTCNLWNVLPSSCFPESYNFPSFKSKINKLDLISLPS